MERHKPLWPYLIVGALVGVVARVASHITASPLPALALNVAAGVGLLVVLGVLMRLMLRRPRQQPARRTRPPAQAQRVEAGERWEFERIGPWIEEV